MLTTVYLNLSLKDDKKVLHQHAEALSSIHWDVKFDQGGHVVEKSIKSTFVHISQTCLNKSFVMSMFLSLLNNLQTQTDTMYLY